MNDGVLLSEYSMSMSSCHVDHYVQCQEEEFFPERQSRLTMGTSMDKDWGDVKMMGTQKATF